MIRWLTAGESHGPALSAIIEGIPAHVLITSKDIDADLSRRRLGFGRGARQNFEADKITITGGIRLGSHSGWPNCNSNRKLRVAKVGKSDECRSCS